MQARSKAQQSPPNPAKHSKYNTRGKKRTQMQGDAVGESSFGPPKTLQCRNKTCLLSKKRLILDLHRALWMEKQLKKRLLQIMDLANVDLSVLRTCLVLDGEGMVADGEGRAQMVKLHKLIQAIMDNVKGLFNDEMMGNQDFGSDDEAGTSQTAGMPGQGGLDGNFAVVDDDDDNKANLHSNLKVLFEEQRQGYGGFGSHSNNTTTNDDDVESLSAHFGDADTTTTTAVAASGDSNVNLHSDNRDLSVDAKQGYSRHMGSDYNGGGGGGHNDETAGVHFGDDNPAANNAVVNLQSDLKVEHLDMDKSDARTEPDSKPPEGAAPPPLYPVRPVDHVEQEKWDGRPHCSSRYSDTYQDLVDIATCLKQVEKSGGAASSLPDTSQHPGSMRHLQQVGNCAEENSMQMETIQQQENSPSNSKKKRKTKSSPRTISSAMKKKLKIMVLHRNDFADEEGNLEFLKEKLESCLGNDSDSEASSENKAFLLPLKPVKFRYSERNPRGCGTKKILCELCGKLCAHRGEYHVHMKSIHTGERPFVCQDCGKGFCTQNMLVKHRVIHSAHRPFLCTICDRAFKHKNNWVRHSMTHSKEKPFKCLTCDKNFKYSGSLRLHQRTLHNVP